MIKAVIFDMDGLLLDTEILYQNAWIEYGKIYNYDISAHFLTTIRGKNAENIEKFCKEKFGWDFDFLKASTFCYTQILKYSDAGEINIKNGVVELLDYLKKENYKIGLATSSNRSMGERILKKANLLKYFDVKVYGDMVENSKPNPDIFLLAVDKLKVMSKECVVLEDSANGILAAHAANCVTALVPDIDQPLQSTINKSNYVLENVAQLINVLKNVF